MAQPGGHRVLRQSLGSAGRRRCLFDQVAHLLQPGDTLPGRQPVPGQPNLEACKGNRAGGVEAALDFAGVQQRARRGAGHLNGGKMGIDPWVTKFGFPR